MQGVLSSLSKVMKGLIITDVEWLLQDPNPTSGKPETLKTLVHSAGLVHASVRAAILAWCSFYRDIRPGQHADAIVPGNLWAPVTVFSVWVLSHP